METEILERLHFKVRHLPFHGYVFLFILRNQRFYKIIIWRFLWKLYIVIIHKQWKPIESCQVIFHVSSAIVDILYANERNFRGVIAGREERI